MYLRDLSPPGTGCKPTSWYYPQCSVIEYTHTHTHSVSTILAFGNKASCLPWALGDKFSLSNLSTLERSVHLTQQHTSPHIHTHTHTHTHTLSSDLRHMFTSSSGIKEYNKIICVKILFASWYNNIMAHWYSQIYMNMWMINSLLTGISKNICLMSKKHMVDV